MKILNYQADLDKKYLEKEYIYRGLKSLVENGGGVGFCNADMGHPVYRAGASDTSPETLKALEYADSPKKNLLFKMLSRLSKELKKSSVEKCTWWYDFSEWRDFCKFAIEIYEKKLKTYKI